MTGFLQNKTICVNVLLCATSRQVLLLCKSFVGPEQNPSTRLGRVILCRNTGIDLVRATFSVEKWRMSLHLLLLMTFTAAPVLRSVGLRATGACRRVVWHLLQNHSSFHSRCQTDQRLTFKWKPKNGDQSNPGMIERDGPQWEAASWRGLLLIKF